MSSLARERLASTRADCARSKVGQPASVVCVKCDRKLLGRLRKDGKAHAICPRRKRKRGTPAKSRKAHRHAKVDRNTTELFIQGGIFLDRKSFVSGKGCLYLEGKDKSNQRWEVFEAAEGTCWDCGVFASWETGQWDHIKNKPGERCDCLHNSRWSCAACHRKRHVQVGGSKRSAAA